MTFLRTPGRKIAPFKEADAEKFLLSQGFRPATPEEIRTAREAIARTDATIARQFASA